MRLGLRSQADGQPDSRTFRQVLETAVALKAANGVPLPRFDPAGMF